MKSPGGKRFSKTTVREIFRPAPNPFSSTSFPISKPLLFFSALTNSTGLVSLYLSNGYDTPIFHHPLSVLLLSLYQAQLPSSIYSSKSFFFFARNQHSTPPLPQSIPPPLLTHPPSSHTLKSQTHFPYQNPPSLFPLFQKARSQEGRKDEFEIKKGKSRTRQDQRILEFEANACVIPSPSLQPHPYQGIS